MIKVEFVSNTDERVHVASFKDEDVYVSCLEVLEAIALKSKSKIEETLLDDKEPIPSWEGTQKILHEGYWYTRYTDLHCKIN
tara:strand:+ start:1823 stop:2068 length:246 start_codon:yes stop_codon:yes gene_type:complete